MAVVTNHAGVRMAARRQALPAPAAGEPVVVGDPALCLSTKETLMKNWKHATLIALFIGLSATAHAQGGGQGKMYKHGASGTQTAGQGGQKRNGGGQGTQTRTQDGTHIGGEEALRERMRTQTPTAPTTTATTTTVTQ